MLGAFFRYYVGNVAKGMSTYLGNLKVTYVEVAWISPYHFGRFASSFGTL